MHCLLKFCQGIDKEGATLHGADYFANDLSIINQSFPQCNPGSSGDQRYGKSYL